MAVSTVKIYAWINATSTSNNMMKRTKPNEAIVDGTPRKPLLALAVPYRKPKRT